MFEKVLICTDFADGLHRLANFVSSFGLAGIKEIVFLHVVPLYEKGIIPRVDSEKIEQAETRLTEAVGENITDVEVKTVVQSGKAVETILKVAQTYKSELIILGSQSRSLLTEKLVGSTMVDLSRQTRVPLLIVRPQLIWAYTCEELALRCQHLFRSLLIPYNGSQVADYLVQQIKHLAEKEPGKFFQQCKLCWILENSDRPRITQKILPQQANETLYAIKADLESVNLQVDTEIREGSCVTEFLDIAVMADISAIAVSSGTMGKLQEWLISSFAAEILRRSWYPVLFFPSQNS
ncbi:universal stress protein [Anabaena subtropica]|uniref:Universal stress protein n=1 Tax=Anabaena subtropica FACHB-260 TaxID=2692884 RepID=A0ABR8CUE8_9NOST|nr:universal stress protein [Anabaena subtropica]MBD2346821.1 universal stress protein [Anabaena subtropica FACHB-260]